MNFEFLIEDASGKVMLEILLPKIIDTNTHSYRIFSYRSTLKTTFNWGASSEAGAIKFTFTKQS